jgi:uncharacterized protein (DUF362 family)
MITKKVIIRDTGESDIYDIVKEAFFTFLTIEKVKNSNFIVKPNLGFKTGTKGGTTNVEIIEATLKIIRDNYEPKNIYLVESDGLALRCEDVFQYLNLDSVCSTYGAKFMNLSKEQTITIKNDDCNILKDFKMPKIFTEDNTILVNLAKIKTHEIARFSCAIKNLFGLSDIFRVKYHPVIDDVLRDVYMIFKPDLTIVDGVWAIDGHGPWTGEPVNLNTIVASNDALLADVECLKIIGWDVEDVPYIKKLINTRIKLNYMVDGDFNQTQKFQWQKPSKVGLVKEKLVRIAIPFLKIGFPLCYYSRGYFKIIRYGGKGKYCKTIKSYPQKK